MAKPWEEYQSAAPNKPWEEYQQAPIAQPQDNSGLVDGLSIKNVPQNLGNLVAGAVRGAGSIGATILTPYDLAMGNTQSIGNPERRQAMDAGFQQMGADTESGLYATGKLGGEIAGTAGVGEVIAPLAAAAKMPMVANAIGSGGFNLGSKAIPVNGAKEIIKQFLARNGTRALGGAVTAGSQGAMINPESAPTSAVIGAALPTAGQVLLQGGKLASHLIGGFGTHTGGESLIQATKAGFNGGKSQQAFADNMRGNVPMTDVLDDAKANLMAIGQQKLAEYKSGMSKVSADKSILNFSGIDKAMNDAANIASFKGQSTNESASRATQEVAEAINKWKALDPAEYHTPEGLDALKKVVSGIQESIPFEQKTARLAIGKVYNSIKNEITKQAPVYAKTMKGYSDASDKITEIEKALSLGNKSAIDTSMRKLQSLMRNNANTNYGNRLDLAKTLEQQGGREIMPALAGQSLSSITPRGLGSAVGGAVAGGAGYIAGLPAGLAALAVQSPRLMGEAALKAGQSARALQEIMPATGALSSYLYDQN